MADVTGTLRRDYNGKSYAMRLTPLGIAALQDRYGNDFLAQIEKTQGLPNLRLFVDIVTEALVKGEAMPRDEAHSLADDLVASDLSLPLEIIQAAFPAVEGAAPAAEGGKGNAKARQG